MLALHGSYGRGIVERCRLLARSGLVALGLRWHGNEGRPSGTCEILIETFTRALDLLRDAGLKRLCVLGLSKGAEAALWLSDLDRRIDVVVALSPTFVAWQNLGQRLFRPTGGVW
ncbi:MULTISPECIES: hypothetical protein [unclassified Streptomyces]|uniref:hypothetical protein n=1 Tax=unclassified Streptomyces TaxID=2593676 RepID=UPI002ED62C24|nr:hypothetical protein OH827_32820 [Streptomyces sp. NBC_00891]WSY09526.1 hypothetical protein OG464_32825 [Streptomyces sp. NBC_00890]WSZ11146.1 hypothetical protein OG704_32825 [Streptomyces sp. NBC_00869]WSZ21348.1 hypothetical protein OG498_00740 [Streptomyces sp. NBC_00870]